MPSTEKIPFEQLPQTVLELKQERSGLKTLITGLMHNKPEDNTDQWMNMIKLDILEMTVEQVLQDKR